VQLCIKLDLIAGNILFVDGSKIRGNAAIKHSWNKEKGLKVIEKAEKRIEEVLREAEALDAEEEGQPSLISVPTQLAEPRSLQQKVERIMEELRQSGKKNLNTVDRECTTINGVQGTGAGYTAEVVVDDKHGLIVNADVVSTNNDFGQFSVQINQSQEILGKAPEIAVADSGFADTTDLEKIDNQGIQVVVPSQRLAITKPIGEFDKDNFRYDKSNDCYICPQGEKLQYRRLIVKEASKEYTTEDKETCPHCLRYKQCTNAKLGRTVMRLLAEETRERLEQEYALPENQAIYKLRQARIELVFGHFKRNLGVSSFLLRGVEGARAEIDLLSMCFNVRRMITLLGQKGLIKKLREDMLAQYASFFTKKVLSIIFSEKATMMCYLDIYSSFIIS
jgi:hypothetical protein